ncbi:universal stress protein [Halobaculum magnesiiphilum]|uniref:Universal stress protein n=1 Tax=Halobaculum magnesiiphilum TaxID=1017351 RepID=A0A8T8WBZ6_9EURY|nr:universal stress protein [Halobaculum magnesiiphilum]QZP37377.1 universal stress protein [Halobaculum magnesiiphilum]
MATTSSSIDAVDEGAVGSGATAVGAFDRVLLAVDGDTDERVREVAVSLAAAHGAELDVLSVVPLDSSVDHWDMVVERREDEAEAALDGVGEVADAAGVPVSKRLRYGTPAEEIGLYADGNDVDLVVVAEPDRSGFKRLFSPSNLASDVRDATAVPVVSVPTNE